MPREIKVHQDGVLNKELRVFAMDEPGIGGAHHVYEIDQLPPGETPCTYRGAWVQINFQNGPLGDGQEINGVSNEALLAIVIDRLECFNAGPFACKENSAALAHLKIAMSALHQRTRDRIERGVEGKLER